MAEATTRCSCVSIDVRVSVTAFSKQVHVPEEVTKRPAVSLVQALMMQTGGVVDDIGNTCVGAQVDIANDQCVASLLLSGQNSPNKVHTAGELLTPDCHNVLLALTYGHNALLVLALTSPQRAWCYVVITYRWC